MRTGMEARPAAHVPHASPWATFIVVPENGRLTVVDAAAAALLGLDLPISAGVRLDPGMPALLTLRDWLSVGGEGPESLDLVLWTRAGVVHRRCLCRRRAMGGAEAAVEVVVGDGVGGRQDSTGPVATADASAMSDLDVLARIARSIREGARRGASLDDVARDRAPVRGDAPDLDTAPVLANGALSAAGSRPSALGHEATTSGHMTAAGVVGSPDVELPAEVMATLARLAHELKTPLSAIATLSEVLRDERFGPIENARYLDYARSIHDSARHALGVVDGMLDRHALREGLARPEYSQVDVDALVMGCIAALEEMAREKSLTLVAALQDRLPNLVADRRALNQILLNLVTNAMKFTPRGGRIVVSTRYVPDGTLSIIVTDDGRGMAAGDVSRATTGEAVGETAAGRPGGGHGFGLPLVIALAKANGATIEIESAPGRGTSVAVCFARDRVVPI